MATKPAPVTRPSEDCRSYKLVCQVCGAGFEDDGITLDCPHSHEPGLLQSSYDSNRFKVQSNAPGLFRYSNWLPAVRHFADATGTVTYRSKQLAQRIGASNLWIAFNGYWPEKGARLHTATFKELEAYAVLSRRPDRDDRVLVVSSAGNTGAAFAQVCSAHRVPCLIIVPDSALGTMNFDHPISDLVKLVIIRNGTYDDAQKFAAVFTKEPSFVAEGGVRNIARRDGIGTTLLNAFETMGRLPDAYFQAIGSGTGAIAVKEAAKRLIASGAGKSGLPKLILSQNEPFAPIYQTWKEKRRDFIQLDPATAQCNLKQILARVLSNSNPPYAIAGGLYDSLVESEGDVLAVRNEDVLAGVGIFEETEGIDLEPPAGVAVASLIHGLRDGSISRDACILLHVTAGGLGRRAKEIELYQARPALEIEKQEVSMPASRDAAMRLFH